MYTSSPDALVIAQIAGLEPSELLFYVTVVASITLAGAVAVVTFVTVAPRFSSSWADQLGERVDEAEATDYREVVGDPEADAGAAADTGSAVSGPEDESPGDDATDELEAEPEEESVDEETDGTTEESVDEETEGTAEEPVDEESGGSAEEERSESGNGLQ